MDHAKRRKNVGLVPARPHGERQFQEKAGGWRFAKFGQQFLRQRGIGGRKAGQCAPVAGCTKHEHPAIDATPLFFGDLSQMFRWRGLAACQNCLNSEQNETSEVVMRQRANYPSRPCHPRQLEYCVGTSDIHKQRRSHHQYSLFQAASTLIRNCGKYQVAPS